MSGLLLPAKLDPGQSASFTVTYSPTSAGDNSGAINLTSDASNPEACCIAFGDGDSRSLSRDSDAESGNAGFW